MKICLTKFIYAVTIIVRRQTNNNIVLECVNMGLFDFLKKYKKAQLIKDPTDKIEEAFENDNINKVWEVENLNDRLINLYDYLCNKSDYGEKISLLSEAEKIIYLEQAFECEINNGGFDQFFFNPSGDYTYETLEALKSISADKTALILEKAISIFGKKKIPSDQTDRQNLLEKIENEKTADILDECDEKFYAYEDDLSALCLKYIEQNLEQFT